jgi:hypothetical protein
MFSVTQNGIELDKSKYNWDEVNKVFSTNENFLVLDFSDYFGVIFLTGSYCTFTTGLNCIFNTGWNCTFNTGSYCTFKTGSDCTFNTGSDCTFNTGCNCTFKTGDNCVIIRYDVKGVIEIPKNKTIKLKTINLNGYRISGYTEIEEKLIQTCEGKVVKIEGKKYKLVSV